MTGHSVNYSMGTLSRGIAGRSESQLNTQDVKIEWEDDGALNTSFQELNFDSYYTVPEGATGCYVSLDIRDGITGSNIKISANQSANISTVLMTLVANLDVYLNARLRFADGTHSTYIQCNINPNLFSRIWIRVLEWCFD